MAGWSNLPVEIRLQILRHVFSVYSRLRFIGRILVKPGPSLHQKHSSASSSLLLVSKSFTSRNEVYKAMLQALPVTLSSTVNLFQIACASRPSYTFWLRSLHIPPQRLNLGRGFSPSLQQIKLMFPRLRLILLCDCPPLYLPVSTKSRVFTLAESFLAQAQRMSDLEKWRLSLLADAKSLDVVVDLTADVIIMNAGMLIQECPGIFSTGDMSLRFELNDVAVTVPQTLTEDFLGKFGH